MNDLLNAELIRRLQNSHPELSKAKLKLMGGKLNIFGCDAENSNQIFELKGNINFCVKLKNLGINHITMYDEKEQRMLDYSIKFLWYILVNQPTFNMQTGRWSFNPIDIRPYIE